jgi:hypothetical protein
VSYIRAQTEQIQKERRDKMKQTRKTTFVVIESDDEIMEDASHAITEPESPEIRSSTPEMDLSTSDMYFSSIEIELDGSSKPDVVGSSSAFISSHSAKRKREFSKFRFDLLIYYG